MNIPQATNTPIGSSAVGATLAAIVVSLLGLWPPYAHLPTAVTNAIGAFAVFLGGYLSGWLKVVKSPGQTFDLGLTASPLPTLQETEPKPAEEVAA